jgi:hypothetical protein
LLSKARPNRLFEEAAENVAKALVGRLVQTRQDPILKALGFEADQGEPTVGMLVKITTPEQNTDDPAPWHFDILIGEKVKGFHYSNFTDFSARWELVETEK